jgi:ribose transport system substrate-binding protein
MSRPNTRSVLAIACVAVSLCCAACGSSKGTSQASNASSSSSSTGGGNVAAASAVLAKLASGDAAPFPVTQPLAKRLPAGTKFGFMECDDGQCVQFAQILQQAVKQLGAQLTIVKAQQSASSEQSAMSSIIAQKPAGVIVAGVAPDAIAPQLNQLNKLHIPVVSVGLVGASRYGITFDPGDNPVYNLDDGYAEAAWVVVHMHTPNAVFYYTPEVPFSAYVEQGFDSEMKTLCPSCTVRNVDIPVADYETTAPSLVVTDLQAHPSTNVAVFALAEAEVGLPSALKTAGLHPTITGTGPPPAVWDYIKAGEIASGITTDSLLPLYLDLDVLARLVTHEPLASGEKALLAGTFPPPYAVIDQKSMTFNPQVGWAAYPNLAQLFAKLWSK